MKLINCLLLVIICVFSVSCYHAQIITDAQPSGQVIDEPWAHGFIFGLVPPKEIRTASECPNGVAKVETQISFLNGLVSAITFNIYTPMHITVTCASGGTSAAKIEGRDLITISDKSDDREVIKGVQQASEKSLELKKPVYLIFE